MMSRLPGENVKKKYFFFELLPFANLGSQIIIASSFKHGQLTDDE